MLIVACVSFGVISTVALLQLAAFWRTYGMLGRWRRTPLADVECPEAVVILAVRGHDAELARCIRALCRQAYPRYAVRVVVDGLEDPAWRTVEAALAGEEAAHVNVDPLRERPKGCSLKCASVVQAVSGISESAVVIAFLDADVVPHATWLRELVAPLVRDGAGLASGQRWYMPADPSIGALVRYFWNAGRVIVGSTQLAWGGSFAITRQCLFESKIPDHWHRSLSVDGIVNTLSRRQGYRLAFVPTAVVVGRGPCGLAEFLRWAPRQMLSMRLYMPAWRPTLAHGILSAAALMSCLATAAMGATASRWLPATLGIAGLAFYALSSQLIVILLESRVRAIVGARGEATRWVSWRTSLAWPVALPLAQLSYLWALLVASVTTSVEWRGVRYRVDGPWDVAVIDDPAASPAPASPLPLR